MADNPTNPGVSTDPVNPMASESGGSPTATYSTPDSTVNRALTGAESTTDAASVTRMQQQLAKQNRLMQSIGIDPNSDIADRVESGLVTGDQVLASLATPTNAINQPQPEQANMIAPQKSNIATHREKMAKEGVTETGVLEHSDAIEAEIEGIKTMLQEEKLQKVATSCADITHNVLMQDQDVQNMPPELRQIADQLFMSSTDNLVMQEAKQSNNPDAYLNPNMYDFMARKQADDLQKLRMYWIEQGKTSAINGTPVSNINPIPPSAGGSPSSPGPARGTKSTWKEMAKQAERNMQYGVRPQ